ncbi:unnamed protein product [Eruca vesicaria subsp. sativa]|uniref:Uncharacterized protein n=1 Tax=Eruca vesicaria subsp. sativa TaxID=29727 RepID=A0ABC8LSJ0_ERUVS|nr:unnamed protein product [Eruca vesicaria subsp. sativa]
MSTFPLSDVDLLYKQTFFSDLKSGWCSSTVEARLLRDWEARNVKRGGELMGLTFHTIMQATISVNRDPSFQSRLTALMCVDVPRTSGLLTPP